MDIVLDFGLGNDHEVEVGLIEASAGHGEVGVAAISDVKEANVDARRPWLGSRSSTILVEDVRSSLNGVCERNGHDRDGPNADRCGGNPTKQQRHNGGPTKGPR